ncbi:hypothetical protein NKJ23_20960 [Mesorhizobium sp. M0184]|uniref:hypothetical protein n=1 Tax=Mesorhizobium sp. M0184 TaxID=2956906 RepID=UPI003339472E
MSQTDFYDNVASSFMRAYVGCLSVDELCDAAIITLKDPLQIHMAIRKRLARLCEERRIAVDDLSVRLIEQGEDRHLRSRIEACLSHLLMSFSPAQRLFLLDRWEDKNTSSAWARWLKAINGDNMHYGDELIAKCWQTTRDPRAAKVLVSRGAPEILKVLASDFIVSGVEGWIVGKAIIRAGGVSDDVWDILRERQPATYAYLCAKQLRPLSESEAIQVVLDSPDEFHNGGKGLAIWSLGQLGLEHALDELWIKLR